MDGIRIMEQVHKRGAFIMVLDRPGLDLSTPTGRGLALLSGLAEEERLRYFDSRDARPMPTRHNQIEADLNWV
jgi:DNA invertase Pin-like site-specific DNA recombinase